MTLRQEAADILRGSQGYRGIGDSPNPEKESLTQLDALLDWFDTNAVNIASEMGNSPAAVRRLVAVLRDDTE